MTLASGAPRARFYALAGLRFHALEWGGPLRPTRAPARSIVLLHGLASQAHIWDLVAPRLAEPARVIALDQRGHGLTDKPESGYDFATIARDLELFLNAAQIERPALVGHSWGGNVALEYAARHPDRVAALVFVDGGFLEIGARLDWPAAEKQLEPPDLAGMPLTALQAGLRNWLGPAWSEATAAITLHNFEVLPDQTVRPRMRKVNHMKVVRALWEHRPSQLYAQVRCPVLLLPAIPPGPLEAAAQERLAGKRASVAQAEERLAHSRTIWLADTLHDIPLHRPAELTRAIKDFIEVAE
ncbi:MAG TPA: alpha/beta hydrolase [Anaerolineae bacterium]|nr:alpha/beta hydrolase [Anaerolineae bacterium]